MRLFANPLGRRHADRVRRDRRIRGSAALLAVRDHPALAATLKLDASSRVLLLGSEGDTDPAIYREVVGRPADAVLAA